MQARATIIATIVLFLATPPVWATWLSKEDSKPIADLMLMNDYELNLEAEDACLYVAFYLGRDMQGGNLSDALNYLSTIARVTRQHHNGKDQEWVLRYQRAAMMSKDVNECKKANDEFQKEWSKAKATPSRRRHLKRKSSSGDTP